MITDVNILLPELQLWADALNELYSSLLKRVTDELAGDLGGVAELPRPLLYTVLEKNWQRTRLALTLA